ncbi:MAG: hypothetical protein EHM79_15625 [Geobacter sp.]|nr:MAG: hypothetical protein EHM79_15625 [Geobacter sp.]
MEKNETCNLEEILERCTCKDECDQVDESNSTEEEHICCSCNHEACIVDEEIDEDEDSDEDLSD